MQARDRERFYLSAFFFLSGVCFSTWASRIPTIKTEFGFNEAELGTLLLAMPFSSLAGLPLSGWLVSRFDSRVPMRASYMGLSLALVLIGWAPSTWSLAAAVCLFSFSLRISNISINTQSIAVQSKFERKINGSFHGLWSTGGIVGVGISTLFVGLDISMGIHLTVVAALNAAVALYAFPNLLRGDRSTAGNKFKLGKPDPYIVYLGALVFFALVCEGGMFDWSGVFFKEVVQVELFTLGYLLFMVFMALSRFTSDRLMEAIGMPRTFIFCSTFIMLGIGLAVLWPQFWPALIGFCLVGFGTAAVIPMIFLLAGQSKKYSPGMAISIIATYGTVGMLMGPPLIGYLAQGLGLRYAFVAFAIAGFILIPLSQLFFQYRASSTEKA
jgi:MFS family permease